MFQIVTCCATNVCPTSYSISEIILTPKGGTVQDTLPLCHCHLTQCLQSYFVSNFKLQQCQTFPCLDLRPNFNDLINGIKLGSDKHAPSFPVTLSACVGYNSSKLGYSIIALIEQDNPLYSFQNDYLTHKKFNRSLELPFRVYTNGQDQSVPWACPR